MYFLFKMGVLFTELIFEQIWPHWQLQVLNKLQRASKTHTALPQGAWFNMWVRRKENDLSVLRPFNLCPWHVVTLRLFQFIPAGWKVFTVWVKSDGRGRTVRSRQGTGRACLWSRQVTGSITHNPLCPPSTHLSIHSVWGCGGQESNSAFGDSSAAATTEVFLSCLNVSLLPNWFPSPRSVKSFCPPHECD